MTLMRWKPFGDLVSMHSKINRLFDDALSDLGKDQETFAAWYPATDIYETKDDYVFRLEVPGLAKDDINVELNNNTLTIKGEKKESKEVKKEDYHRVESFIGTFSRSYTLPRNVDSKKIKANMKDGILELHIPKAEEAKPKSISINVG
jgi:HSP20 family protein